MTGDLLAGITSFEKPSNEFAVNAYHIIPPAIARWARERSPTATSTSPAGERDKSSDVKKTGRNRHVLPARTGGLGFAAQPSVHLTSWDWTPRFPSAICHSSSR